MSQSGATHAAASSKSFAPVPETNYFTDDVVCRVAERGLEFGTVAASSVYATSTMPKLKVGQVRVQWHLDGGKLSVELKKSIRLADRSLLPGDKVSGTISGEEETQRGHCRDVKVVSSVRVIGGDIICGVPGELLEPIEGGFVLGDKCCLGSWIGTIGKWTLKVVMAFPDGSICELAERDALELDNHMHHPWSRFGRYDFFKSQLLSGPMSVFKRGNWTNKTDKMARMLDNPKMPMDAVVKEVVPTALTVQWQCQGYCAGASDQKPSSLVVGEDLKSIRMLSALKHGSLRIGDKKLYRLRDEDAVVSMDEWKAVEGTSPGKQAEEPPKVMLAKKRRLASRASSSEPKKPPPVPGDVVAVEVLSRRSKATVVWQSGDVSENVPAGELQPFYSVHCEELFCGQFVVRSPGSIGKSNPRIYGVVVRVDSVARMCLVTWFRIGGCSPTEQGRTEEPVFDVKPHPNFTFKCRSFVVRVTKGNGEVVAGQVLDVNVDGKVLVLWADGSKSHCWPQDIYDIQLKMHYCSTEWLGSSPEQNGPVAGGHSKGNDLKHLKTEQKGGKQPDGNSNCIVVQPPGAASTSDGSRAGGAAALMPGSFAMMESAPSQHKFMLTTYNSTNPRNIAKLARREVQLMRDNLPPGIHVKGYADRMDLYSAMIEGPPKTPYEDGMFFFDIQLPEDYPSTPPKFHYHSYTSDRSNPNLYVGGMVCVSLLGTWSGEGSEKWMAGSSNLLQVLVSIQGLILVGEPYFNEPGYERLKGTRKGMDSSKMYNEMVLLKTVQGTERLLGNPPESFKREVEDRLGRKVENVLERLRTWRLETRGIDFKPPDFPLLPASRGFWISMDRAVGSLKYAMEKKKA